NAIQWSIGLEFALMVKDPWKLCLTTDHPNGGPFIEYPRIMTWLLSSKAREAALARINRRARRKSSLGSIDREYSLYELAIVTRAAPARILGLEGKGHLGVGADADVSLYKLNPYIMDLSKDYKRVREALRRAAYTIKGGEIVAIDGEALNTTYGKTYWVDVEVPEREEERVKRDLNEKFERYYSVKLENYPIEERDLRFPSPLHIRGEGI
ncbi:MAG: amidohydrolase family protein, partial [Candidatus Bathyarchaeia archaeon]